MNRHPANTDASTQLAAAPSSVPSPCIGVCQIDAAEQRCLGCLRSLREIAHWSRMSEAEQRALLEKLPGRRKRD